MYDLITTKKIIEVELLISFLCDFAKENNALRTKGSVI